MEPIKPDFSEANKFVVLNRGFRDEVDKAYKNFWKRRRMEVPDNGWFGDRKKKTEEMETIKK